MWILWMEICTFYNNKNIISKCCDKKWYIYNKYYQVSLIKSNYLFDKVENFK